MIKKKKLLPILLFSLLSITGVAAAWYVFYNTGALLTVTSTEPIQFSDTFRTLTMDATNESVCSENQTITLQNYDSNKTLFFNLNETKTATNPSCLDIENDCQSYCILTHPDYPYETGILDCNDTFVSEAMQTQEIRVWSCCIQNACPSNITLEAFVTEV